MSSEPQKRASRLHKVVESPSASGSIPPLESERPAKIIVPPPPPEGEAHPEELHNDQPQHPEMIVRTAPPPAPRRSRVLARRSRVMPRLPSETRLVQPAPSLDMLAEKVCELLALQGEHTDQDLIFDLIMTSLKLVRDGSTRAELKIMSAALRELRHGFNVFRPYQDRRKITVFGSARTRPDTPEYRQAWDFAEAMVKRDYMVITGAGGGIMEAAQGGAGRANSFGVNIKLPFEQSANRYIAGDAKLLFFRYFFTRKLCFVREASAIALFPGGFGTHDEGFETLTLVQTGKAFLIPIVFIDKPGGEYWREWADYVVEHLLGRSLISEEDMHLFKITDDVQWAVNEVCSFYTRYHSCRFVKDTLVIRMLSRLPKGTVERLNDLYCGFLLPGRGRIVESGPLPEETGEPELASLPRLAFPFNRRNYGKLRLLIDEINRA